MTPVQRYSKEDKMRVDLSCPMIVKEYNRHMGGVDAVDMFIAMYRTALRTKRWYLSIFSQMLDIGICKQCLDCHEAGLQTNSWQTIQTETEWNFSNGIV